MSGPQPRLLVVSSHFPPDFVSGGTLVPERQARGLAQRGWDVSVYAGSLDPARAPLSTWDEDVDGLAVHWIGIEPFTAWDDRRNFDNPGVVADLERHLAEVRPDVVHLHSLQTMGGGLVAAARASGAVTVVTMHDHWWSCARQFLVDPTWVPCCLVVDAGVCGCQVDRPWLEARDAWLREQLASADLVFAPSGIAARVLAANGVPADRLRVVENPVDDVPDHVAPRQGTARPVRFLYAGGHDRLKGSAVVTEAARRLAARQPEGWQLVVHADAAKLAAEAPGALPAAVDVRPPFPPDQLDAVLAGADVLLLPSLARESHSLMTREALRRGVPVVASDSLGPEEVVEPDRNGLVVPTGDAGALAAAMAQVVEHPEVVDRWSAVAVDVAVRGSEEQLALVDRTLRELLEPGAPRSAPGRRPAGLDRVLFLVGIDGAPLRYRAHLPAEALALRGIASDVRHHRDPEVDELALRADAVVVYRVPATVQVLALLDRLRAERPDVPLLFDVDDLIFDPDLHVPALDRLPEDEVALWLEGVRRYRTSMEACDAYIGSTEALLRHAAEVVGLPTHRFANGVGLVLARHADAALRRPRTPGPLRVGYLSGTKTHDGDWAEIEAAVVDAVDELGAELWLGGLLTPSPEVERLGDRLVRLPMQDWRALPGVLRDLDVNLAPLEAGAVFNEAKSAIKWLEAALCATPTIATATEPFREAIDHGLNGLLATTPAEWGDGVRRLLSDDLLRASMGARARRDALLGWSPHRQADRYVELLTEARAQVAAGRVPRPSTFTPVALDEPPLPHPLEPYGDAPGSAPATPPAPPPPSRAARATAALRARAGGLRRAVRDDGWGRALGRSSRAAVRDARRIAAAVRHRLAARR